MSRVGTANEYHIDFRHTECKTQRRVGDGSRVSMKKVVIEGDRSLPIGLLAGVCCAMPAVPGGIGQRALGENAHLPGSCVWERAAQSLLIGNVDRGLQRIKGTTDDDEVQHERPAAADLDGG